MNNRAEYSRLLALTADGLDLTASQYDAAVKGYTSVGEWLGKPDSNLAKYKPVVYPQGSIALGTSVRPLGQEEFDIDAVCQLTLPDCITQKEAKELVGARLRQNATYNKMLKEKNRCWRLQYAGEFHLDVLPAKPDPRKVSPTAIRVPDKELLAWKASDPKGYTYWFEVEKARSLFEAVYGRPVSGRLRSSVEPAPEQDEPYEKMPLQIAVQLLKRHRDLHFEGRDDAPISIIITTLAGQAYKGQEDPLSTMEHLVKTMPSHVKYINGIAYVLNPTNHEENFADKWAKHPERKQAFDEWMVKARQDVTDLTETRLANLEPALTLFGGEKAQHALQEHARQMNSKRGSGLRVNSLTGKLGATGTGTVGVPRNTFFGDRK